MTRFLLILTMLCACQRPPELTPFERAAVHASRQGWAAQGELPTKAGQCDFSRVSIRRVSSQTEFFHLCNYLGTAAACNRLETAPFGGAEWPVIVLAPGVELDSDGEPACHEMMHILGNCAGMPRDYYHSNPKVWVASEYPTAPAGSSAQSRARALMRALPPNPYLPQN